MKVHLVGWEALAVAMLTDMCVIDRFACKAYHLEHGA